jgi:hypothetical protein
LAEKSLPLTARGRTRPAPLNTEGRYSIATEGAQE